MLSVAIQWWSSLLNYDVSYGVAKPIVESDVDWVKSRMPSSFRLPDIVAMTAPVFELKTSEYREEVDVAARAWFSSFNVYEDTKCSKFLGIGRFDLFAALSFPNADRRHLETCLEFFFWAFSTDDFSDEGAFQSEPEKVQASVDRSLSLLQRDDAECPDWPYAAMLHSLLSKIRSSATPGTYRRFKAAFKAWSDSQVSQASNRQTERMPSSAEFILMRRATIGAAMVEAMVEYSLDLNIPDCVFEDPIIRAMSDATSDIMTWPNDLCSFNKEQADGDYQNLVFILMVENRIGLQEAVDLLISMLDQRIQEYEALKSRLPSFGPAVDAEVSKYIKNLEHFVQGTIMWYYISPRYFRGIDVSNRASLVAVPIFACKA